MEIKWWHFVLFRCFGAFFIKTYFNPDEYYQSMEMAHRLAFGYGVITWDWNFGVRTYFYPLVISIAYRILGYFRVDYPYLLTLVPRLMHAIFVAIAETMFYKRLVQIFGKRVANWTTFFMFSNWFVFNLSPRTLTNTVEMAFLLIVLSLYPYKIDKDKKYWSYLVVCAISFCIRCTAAVCFIPLGLHHILCHFSNFKKTLTVALPISLFIFAGFVALDSYYTGELCVSSYNFFKVNIWEQGSTIFGTEAFSFYFTSTLPKVFLTTLPLFACWIVAIWTSFYQPRGKHELRIMSAILILNILVTSLNPHKEDRFLMPIIPLALLIAAVGAVETYDYLKKNYRRKVQRFLVAWFLTLTLMVNGWNIYEKCLYEDYGRHAIVDVLRDTLEPDLRPIDRMPSVMFLGECLGYPLSSVIHRRFVETRYVSCQDQTDFMKSPQIWFYRYMKQLGPDSDHITHIVVTANQFIWNMYRVLYATGFIGDNNVEVNSIPDYKYRRSGDAILLRRDFSEKEEWWYYNATTSKWVFNLTLLPDWLSEGKSNNATLTDLKYHNATVFNDTSSHKKVSVEDQKLRPDLLSNLEGSNQTVGNSSSRVLDEKTKTV
ncbi:GPI mannosyltransferase 3-like [Artemia franciscana]|uniref:Mannosyltransferase n=1 Tax=Artemia franciscana TaxID=6661 RepID=A0AA88I0B5_ARTSF|nr:hypothetical protein QYM36_006409 [Artemia franciscana]